jgi:TonB family protein
MKLVLKTLSWAALMLLASTVFSQSANNAPAKLISMPEYIIPPEASAAGIDGQLAVVVWVNKDGLVDRAVVYAGPTWPCDSTPRREIERVREGVTEAAKKAKFSPAIKDGQPQSAELLLTVLIGERYESEKRRKTLGNKPSDEPKMINGGVINGKALSLPKPEYPAEARANRASGAVDIELLIDENGKVIQAGATSGNPLLQYAARDAACHAKFSPTLLKGQPVKVRGIITYNFVP